SPEASHFARFSDSVRYAHTRSTGPGSSRVKTIHPGSVIFPKCSAVRSFFKVSIIVLFFEVVFRFQKFFECIQMGVPEIFHFSRFPANHGGFSCSSPPVAANQSV